jgi:hypothetical protein
MRSQQAHKKSTSSPQAVTWSQQPKSQEQAFTSFTPNEFAPRYAVLGEL